jgi:hypothetical protein
MESYYRLSMSDWKIPMDAREVRFLNSQDMEYSVKLQKR